MTSQTSLCVVLASALLYTYVGNCEARKWRDTGSGTIVSEEAWIPKELLFQIPDSVVALALQLMNQNNIDFMVISCAQPCIQATSISNNTARFGAFASLFMHNATVAAQN
ncbi:hypothetical protein BDQ17DRAFT_256662 [Cyathus striatus]|nr:hypothetical protein BDQ17DRAFT_256662 [Cyathus striatus]